MKTATSSSNSDECPICRDKRFVIGARGVEPCPRGCAFEIVQARVERLTGLVTVPHPQATLEVWSVEATLPARARVLAAIRERQPLFAMVLGRFGVGKTWLLCATVRTAHAHRLTALYATAVDMLSAIRRGFRDDSAEDVIEALATVDVLALDEIDRINNTQWAEGTLFQILDRRYREGRITVMAANARPNALPGYLTSRAGDASVGAVWELWNAPDLRRLKNDEATCGR